MFVSKLHKSLGSDPLLLNLLRETYGEGAENRTERLRGLCGRFQKTYGDGPVSILSAPARINLLGEHIDYVSYIPTASLTFGSRERDMVLLFRPSTNVLVNGATTLSNYAPFAFEVGDGPREVAPADTDQEWERVLFFRPAPTAHWGNYVRGAVYFGRFKHGERVRRGFDFLVDSSIPPAGGASSSSALTVLAAAAVLRVLSALRAAFKPARPPIVIVSPETEAPLREILRDEDVSFALQPFALGTGDAVLCARDQMRDFPGQALVVWATQPVLRTETVSRTMKLAALFPEYEMIVPTAMMEKPYAPIERDALGHVASAHETHLERIRVSDYGESNIGLFAVRTGVMFRELELLHRELWREVEIRYGRLRAELGFPNELIRRLAGKIGGVFASPIGDWREEKGIKTKADVELCERYIREISE